MSKAEGYSLKVMELLSDINNNSEEKDLLPLYAGYKATTLKGLYEHRRWAKGARPSEDIVELYILYRLREVAAEGSPKELIEEKMAGDSEGP